jgi:amino acid transporter
MMFAFTSFIGFESAALYGEESRNPERSIPLGTYISVGLISVFYGFTSWVAVGAVGADKLQAVAGKELGNLFFALNTQYVNSFLTKVMTLLLVTSLFASLLALHNAASRYMFALGRERILPRFLGVAHGRHQAPSRASLVQTAVNIVVVATLAIAGADPYLNLATTTLGLGTIGIVVLQAAASFSVIGFFRARPDRHWCKTLLAPLLGGLGLIAASVLVVANYSTLTGSSSSLVNSLPWMLAVVAVGGVAYALWLRTYRRAVYAGLAGGEVEADASSPARRPATVATEVA